MSLRRALGLALLLSLVAVIAKFPARVAYAWFAPPGVQLQGISGTVWKGSAAAASINGIVSENLDWDWRARGLFSAALRYQLSTTVAGGFVDTQLDVSPGGTVRLRDLGASLPLATVASVLRLPGVSGLANARFTELEFDGDALTAAVGSLVVTELRIALVGSESLGGFEAEFARAGDDIVAAVEDLDAAVDLAAALTIRPDRSWTFAGQVAAVAATPATLRRNLEFLGPADQRGRRALQFEGRY